MNAFSQKLKKVCITCYYADMLKDVLTSPETLNNFNHGEELRAAYITVREKIYLMDFTNVQVPKTNGCKNCNSANASCVQPECKKFYLATAINVNIKELRELKDRFFSQSQAQPIDKTLLQLANAAVEDALRDAQGNPSSIRNFVILHAYNDQLKDLYTSQYRIKFGQLHSAHGDFSLDSKGALKSILEIAFLCHKSTLEVMMSITQETKRIARAYFEDFVGIYLVEEEKNWWLEVDRLMQSVFGEDNRLPSLENLDIWIKLKDTYFLTSVDMTEKYDFEEKQHFDKRSFRVNDSSDSEKIVCWVLTLKNTLHLLQAIEEMELKQVDRSWDRVQAKVVQLLTSTIKSTSSLVRNMRDDSIVRTLTGYDPFFEKNSGGTGK